MKTTIRLALATALVGALAACAPPKIMLYDQFLPGTSKVARESIKVSGTVGSGDTAATLTNYYVQICDVNGAEQTNCKTTLVIENITNYQVTYRY